MSSKSRRKLKGDKPTNTPINMDISIRFFDNYSRTMDSLRKSLEAIHEKYQEQDAVVNFGVGHIEDKKLTHGISQGATNSGVYAVVDVLYNPNQKEYIVVTKYGKILRYSWAGSPLPPPVRVPSKSFTRFLYVRYAALYICWTPKKSSFFVAKDDFSIVIDTVALAPIGNIIYGGRKNEENFDIFIISGVSLNKYSYNPTNNVIALQDALKLTDIEAEDAVIEHTCFDYPGEGDRKQWIYVTFKQHCSIIDAANGRVIVTKKNLHETRITAVLATGASEFIVTGDATGMLKLWGNRWTYLTEIHPHISPVSHLIEHPNGRAVLSFSDDQLIFAWSFDSQLKLETLTAPEIVMKIAANPERKSFLTQGPRNLIIWKMNDLYRLHTRLSAPVSEVQLTWHPDVERRAYVLSQDNAIRIISPIGGQILTSILVNPPKPRLTSMGYIRTSEMNSMFVLTENQEKLEVQRFDCSLNPAKLVDTWDESVWETAVTCFDIYDYVASVILAEKHMSFAKKHEHFTGKETFLIAGRRDGCISRVQINTGEMDYFTTCHKGPVHRIEINHELNQFVSLGNEPSLRLWKIAITQEDLFIPLFDISWKHSIRHVALVREIIGFALSHPESPTHRIVLYNTAKTVRMDHRVHYSHEKEILSFSSSKELVLFCSSSLDETVRVWDEHNELIRVISLNWIPSAAGFGSLQGDIFVGIQNELHVIPADKYLSVIYRNRVMMGKMSAGTQEPIVPLNVAKTGQDARMYIVAEESPIKPEPLGAVQFYKEPEDSQLAKEYELLRLRQLDLQLIVEGKHPFDTSLVPDYHNMSKKQWDEFGKTLFDDDDEKVDRKFFISEARQALMLKMEASKKDLNNFANIEP